MSIRGKSGFKPFTSLLIGATGLFVVLTVVPAKAQNLKQVQDQSEAIHQAASQSQKKINSLHDESQAILAEYRSVLDEVENLAVYNKHMKRLIEDQDANIDSLERQITQIESTKKGIVPLMYRMIDTLETFIALDVPIHGNDRQERVARLRNILGRADVTTSEKYRQVLEAYQIETDYGSMLSAYEGKLNWDGKEINVDFVHLGRVVLLAQSQDLKNAWYWNRATGQWSELEDDYLRSVTAAIRMARKQTAPDLIKMPVAMVEVEDE